MKLTLLARSLALVISFELISGPIVEMVQAQDSKSGGSAGEAINSGAEILSSGISALGKIWDATQARQNMGVSPQVAGDMQQLQEQQKPQPDKYFNAQKLMMIPGLGNYLALNGTNPALLDCKTLPTTLFEARPEVCRLGITADKGGPPPQQMGDMLAYYNQYFQINKLYKNFTADSNSGGQLFGVGCMNNAMNILNGFFKYRLDELDKLLTNLEALQNSFKQASRADLDALEEAVAVLDGSSELADKVRSKNPDLFDFAKRFNNPACNSLFSGDSLNEKGRAGGLNAINSDLKVLLTTKSGKYSGESYSKSHIAVVEDIDSLADKVSKQLELNFGLLSKDPGSYGKFLVDLPELVASPIGTNRALSPDLFSDVRTKFNATYIKLNEQKNTILSELKGAGIPGDAATTLLGNPASDNFESEVVTIENRLKNKCLENSLAEIDRNVIMDKIYDPTASDHANKFGSNYLKDKLNRILNNTQTSLEKKLAELKALEEENGGKYYLKLENKYELQKMDEQGNLQTSTVDATPRTPGLYFIDLIENCNAQFNANKLDNKLTGASAIKKLRDLNQQFKALAKNQAIDVKKEIRKKLIECNTPEDANNSVPGSCTPDRFNTSAPGFCANGALSCSKNMQECTAQSNKFVKEIKDQKTARVNNYKAMVEKNKQDVVKIFDSALSRYMIDGEAIRGIFGAGFSSPSGIQREVPEQVKYLNEFKLATTRSIDGNLLLEDPDRFIDMFKNNIKLLKDSVKKQQDQILGGEATGLGKDTPGLLAAHIRKTEENYKKVISESEKISSQCLSKHDEAVKAAEAARAEQQKKMSELGEKRDEFCNLYGMARTNPQAMCSQVQSDLVKDTLKSVSDISPTQQAALREDVMKLNEYCNQFGNYNEKDTPSPDSAYRICRPDNLGSLSSDIRGLCEKLNTLTDNSQCKELGSSSNGQTVTIDKCSDLKTKIVAIYNPLSSKPGSTSSNKPIDLSSPAYCSAGDTSSGRSSAKSISDGIKLFGDTLSQELGKGVAR